MSIEDYLGEGPWTIIRPQIPDGGLQHEREELANTVIYKHVLDNAMEGVMCGDYRFVFLLGEQVGSTLRIVHYEFPDSQDSIGEIDSQDLEESITNLNIKIQEYMASTKIVGVVCVDTNALEIKRAFEKNKDLRLVLANDVSSASGVSGYIENVKGGLQEVPVQILE